MIRRTLWLGIGIGIGVSGTRRVQALMPKAVAERSVGGATGFLRDVREGMRDREAELRNDLGLKRKDV